MYIDCYTITINRYKTLMFYCSCIKIKKSESVMYILEQIFRFYSLDDMVMKRKT